MKGNPKMRKLLICGFLVILLGILSITVACSPANLQVYKVGTDRLGDEVQHGETFHIQVYVENRGDKSGCSTFLVNLKGPMEAKYTIEVCLEGGSTTVYPIPVHGLVAGEYSVVVDGKGFVFTVK